MPDLKDIKIFISYAREDAKFLEDIKRYALRFHNTQQIEIWDDGKIDLGVEWDAEIKKHLNDADIVLMLISMDFLDSDYINKTELKTAIERHQKKECKVIPILVRSSPMEDYPELSKLQRYPKETAFSDIEKEKRDKYYIELTQGIKNVINEIRTKAGIEEASYQNNQQKTDNISNEKSNAENVLQQENSLPKILLAHSDDDLSNTLKDFFFSEIERERKYKGWQFDVQDFLYANSSNQHQNPSEFLINIITSEADIPYIKATTVNKESSELYQKTILWISKSALEEKIPAELKSNKIVVGTRPAPVIEMIYLLEKERNEYLSNLKESYSQQMNIYMLYDYEKDHDNPVRIDLKEKIENKNEVLPFYTPPDPSDIKNQLALSKGVIIFYGTSDKNWYCHWQAEVQKIYSLKERAVCLSDPLKDIKIRRDISKRAFLVMDDEQKLDEYVTQFVERLKMQA